jgi:hypothetical protein
MLFFQSPSGTLAVEVEGDADVRFQNGELRILSADGQLRFTLKPSERSVAAAPGRCSVSVASADGVKLHTDKFEMSRNGKVVVRVTAERPREPKNTTSAPKGADER